MTISHVSRLAPEQLRRRVDPSSLVFGTTDELEPLGGLLAQRRAEAAIDFGTRIDKGGFNLFVIGRTGRLAREAVVATLKTAAGERNPASDWVYVNNFKEPHKPSAIALPVGRAPAFRDAMRNLVEDLRAALPAVFQSEEYQTRRSAIDSAFQREQEEAFSALQKRARERDVALVRTPLGFTLAPLRNGEVIQPEAFKALPEAEREEARRTIEELEKELERVIHQIPQWERRRREEVKQLNAKTARSAVESPLDELTVQFSDLPRIVAYLEEVRADLAENVSLFMLAGDAEGAGLATGLGTGENNGAAPGGPFDRYRVNVLVSQEGNSGEAPIVEEAHPTLNNLTGRIEHIASHGFLATNFRLIKPGALHRANGGFLLLDARALLSEPFSWRALKLALRRGEIVIEDINRLIGLTSTISLEPAPIPLDVKVVLFGDRRIHFLLAALDPDLAEHFKVLADFDDSTERSEETERLLARGVAGILKREDLQAMDRDGVSLVLEQAARMAEHGGRLSLSIDQLRDLLAEADHYARTAGQAVISRADVQKALDGRIDRASRVRDRLREQILEEVALIDTSGAAVGQINGLSVFAVAGQPFGRPTRITCQVRPGAGKVIDIEREVELGGPLHSKGVLILSGFLAGRFALDAPMSLQASLVFEQSYSGVEGDSASSAELYALLSAIGELSLRQDLAVTGSVNQHGRVQAIGGVNEKIEGFFDICRARGLTGAQGVLIPAANVEHLMLREDVVSACRDGRFSIYPIVSIDEGIALLTGCPAGMRDAGEAYPSGSVYRWVEDRLRAFAEIRRNFAAPGSSSNLR
jgi:lon-related putative ATP-dependent protease